MPVFLAAAFLIAATLYASVGFGGGSTYNALLIMSGADYRILPTIALVCNIIVVCGGVYQFSRSGDLSVKRLMPFLVASVPAAWIGGRIPVSETVFVGLFGSALLLSGVLLILQRSEPQVALAAGKQVRAGLFLPAGIGCVIGLLSGIVGIGGGIFLAPTLYFWRWGSPRQIAAASSLFILVNSLAGLAGQLTKLQDMAILSLAIPYWPLPIAVLIGGQIGSWLAGYKLNPTLIQRLTAILILYVAARLIYRWTGMV